MSGEEWESVLVTISKKEVKTSYFRGGLASDASQIKPWSGYLFRVCAGLNLPIVRTNDHVFTKPPNSKNFDSKEKPIVYLLKTLLLLRADILKSHAAPLFMFLNDLIDNQDILLPLRAWDKCKRNRLWGLSICNFQGICSWPHSLHLGVVSVATLIWIGFLDILNEVNVPPILIPTSLKFYK